MPDQKIILGEMRASGVRALLVFCTDHKCSNSIELVPAEWISGRMTCALSDLEPRFTCKACGWGGADVRPHFGLAKMGTAR